MHGKTSLVKNNGKGILSKGQCWSVLMEFTLLHHDYNLPTVVTSMNN